MQTKLVVLALAGGFALASCGSHHDRRENEDLNLPPSYLGAINSKTYDGVSDDLLTAGLGKTGLAGPTPA